jgi:transportin-3
LMALARLYSPQVVQWAQEAAALIPSNVVTEGERMSFLQAIQSSAAGTDSALTSSIEEMSDVCRRNKKVMEAVQSALQPLQLSLSPVS